MQVSDNTVTKPYRQRENIVAKGCKLRFRSGGRKAEATEKHGD